MIRALKRRVLRETEARINRYGWRRGYFGGRQSGYCLVGAVRASSRRPHLILLRPLIYRDLDRCTDANRKYPWHMTNLILWNDEAYRSIGEVRDALRCARGEPVPR